MPEARDTPEPPTASIPPRPAPRTEEERDSPPPIDLPAYAQAIPGVASGLRPFPDGFDWLKGRGYKTVLHLRQPGEDNTAAQRQVESKGLRYTSLVVSPARLTRDLSDEFNRAVSEPANQPLYVYDKDGTLAGALWYLYFRRQEKVSPEKALAEATRLGLKKDEDGEARTMWLAIQKLLEKP
jgi:protein tyrosine phosphatase (PTP) superfamily phosphohydrolase (DUF442 family)